MADLTPPAMVPARDSNRSNPQNPHDTNPVRTRPQTDVILDNFPGPGRGSEPILK